MHCAAYYGLQSTIPLLLMYGIPIKIKNLWDHYPEKEACNPQISRLLKNSQQNMYHNLVTQLLDQKIALTTFNLKIDPQSQKVDIKKIVLKNYMNNFNDYQNAFHGTSFQALKSIAQHGLRKHGDAVQGILLKTVAGHIDMRATFAGIKNWTNAIFVSHSVYYAAHPLYSKQTIVTQGDKQETYLPVVQVKVKRVHTVNMSILYRIINLWIRMSQQHCNLECNATINSFTTQFIEPNMIRMLCVLHFC